MKGRMGPKSQIQKPVYKGDPDILMNKPMKHGGAVEGKKAKDRADKRARGGKLTAKERNSLSTKSFALPSERKYPIEDSNHARNALARVSQHGSSEQKEKVRAAVHRKYPDIGKK